MKYWVVGGVILVVSLCLVGWYETTKLTRKDVEWDAIVLGAGISGLSAAAYLCLHGKRVLLIERLEEIGGAIRPFTRTVGENTYYFTGGMHGLGNAHSNMLTIFDDVIPPNTLQWGSFANPFEELFIEKEGKLEKVYEAWYPEIKWWDTMKKQFPDDDISAIQEKIESSTAPTESFFEFLHTATSNQDLITVFEHFRWYCGNSYDYTIFELKGILHYVSGGLYIPFGGSHSIIQNLRKSIEKHGKCEILTGCKVTELLTSTHIDSRDAVTGVRACEREERSSSIVSTIGAHNTFSAEKGIVSYELLEKYGYLNIIPKLEMRGSMVHVWFGFNKHPDDLGFPNILTYVDEVGIVCSYRQDGEFFEKPLADLLVFMNTDYSLFKKWENTTLGKRPKEYYAFKETFVERAKSIIAKLYPGALDHLEIVIVGSPLTFRDMLNHHEGNWAGVEGGWWHFDTETPIDGLFLAGQDIISAGVQPVCKTGVRAAKVILSRDD